MHHGIEALRKLEALREAAQIGWNHLDAGRYTDLTAEDLVRFIEQLGIQAHARLRRP